MNSFFQEHQLHNGIVWRISGFQDKTSPWNAKSGKRFGSGLEAVWKRFGSGLEAVWKRFGSGLEAVWKRSGSGSRRGEPQYDNLPYSPHVSEKTSDAYALSIWTKW